MLLFHIIKLPGDKSRLGEGKFWSTSYSGRKEGQVICHMQKGTVIKVGTAVVNFSNSYLLF